MREAQELVAAAGKQFQKLFLEAFVQGHTNSFFIEILLPGSQEKRMIVTTVATISVAPTFAEKLTKI